jgi:uncharacterized protein
VPVGLRIALTVAAGFGTGLLSGMFGIGGAVVSNPALRVLGAAPLQAVGSTLPSIVPSSISGGLRYRREGLLRTRVVAWVALPGVVAAVGGSLLSAHVPGDGHLLTLTISALLVFTAVRTGRAPSPVVAPVPADQSALLDVGDLPPPTASVRTEPWRLLLVGTLAGLLSGLLGIGGGVVMVPLFVQWLRLPLKEALATSLAAVGILAVPGVITHTILGHVDWAFALPLTVAVIPGARIGASLTIRASDRALRRAVASVLGTIGVVYGVTELVNLLRA